MHEYSPLNALLLQFDEGEVSEDALLNLIVNFTVAHKEYNGVSYCNVTYIYALGYEQNGTTDDTDDDGDEENSEICCDDYDDDDDYFDYED